MKLSKAFVAVPRIIPLVCGLYISVNNAAGSMPGDQHWDNQFGPVGASDPLLSVATVGSKVYVGGQLLAAAIRRPITLPAMTGRIGFSSTTSGAGSGHSLASTGNDI